MRTASDHETADDFIFRPQNNHIGSDDLFLALNVLEHLRKWQSVGRKKRGMHGFDVLKKFGLHFSWREVAREFGTVSHRRDPAQNFVGRIEKIE